MEDIWNSQQLVEVFTQTPDSDLFSTDISSATTSYHSPNVLLSDEELDYIAIHPDIQQIDDLVEDASIECRFKSDPPHGLSRLQSIVIPDIIPINTQISCYQDIQTLFIIDQIHSESRFDIVRQIWNDLDKLESIDQMVNKRLQVLDSLTDLRPSNSPSIQNQNQEMILIEDDERTAEDNKRSTKIRRRSKLSKKKSPNYPRLNPSQIKILNTWYKANLDDPYPTRSVKIELASAAKLTQEQVCTWFCNRRRKQSKSQNCDDQQQEQQEEDINRLEDVSDHWGSDDWVSDDYVVPNESVPNDFVSSAICEDMIS